MLSYQNVNATLLIRKLVQEEKYNLIIAHTSLAAFFTRLSIKVMRNRPKLINMVHGYLFDDNSTILKRWIMLGAERLTSPQTDLLITMNQWDFRVAEKFKLGNIVVSTPGVGVDYSRLDGNIREEKMAIRKKYGISENAFVLIYPAEFSARKSQMILIQTMQKLPDESMLLLPGDGILLNDCKNKAKLLGLQDRIFFPGHVTKMGEWYRMADVAVSSSRSEGLPFNIMEAMYFALPIVASNVKGHQDLVRDGVNGFLYPYGDIEELKNCIMCLIKDKNLYKRLSDNARLSSYDYELKKVFPVVTKYYSLLMNG